MWYPKHGQHSGPQTKRSGFDTDQAWLSRDQAKRIPQTISSRRWTFHDLTLPFEQRHLPHLAASDIKGHWADCRRVYPQSLIIVNSRPRHGYQQGVFCFHHRLFNCVSPYHSIIQQCNVPVSPLVCLPAKPVVCLSAINISIPVISPQERGKRLQGRKGIPIWENSYLFFYGRHGLPVPNIPKVLAGTPFSAAG